MFHRKQRWLQIGVLVGVLVLLLAYSSGTGLGQVGINPVTGVRQQIQPTRLARAVAQSALTEIVDGEEFRLVELFEQINPSVVHIHVDRQRLETVTQRRRRRMLQAYDFAGFRGWVSDPNGGSGFVLDDAGHILTTNRVVKDARDIQITFADGTVVSASLIGTDPNTDLAVLKASRLLTTAKPLQFGDSDNLQVGQRVMALGNPLGYGGAMTTGVVSAKARNVTLEIQIDNGRFTAPDLIQTDATILSGAIGGPLIDLGGHVVGVLGVDTYVFDVAGERPVGGVGFSIPASTVQRVVPALLKGSHYPYPWLGISAEDMDPDLAEAMGLPFNQRGALVVRVSPGSPAAKAGLRESDQQVPDLGPGAWAGGDVIIGFQDQSVRDFAGLVSLLFREGTVGKTVTLTVIRDGEQIKVPLTLEERPQ